jgi:hypothetical protein
MKRIALIAAALFALLPASALAGDTYVIHGINGSDLGLDTALPVDISVNGACALTGVTYKGVAGPIALDAGRYDIEVRVNTGADDCMGPLAITDSVTLSIGENATIIASLNEEGSPQLLKFSNDVSATSDARVTVRHTAAAPPVQVRLQDRGRLFTNWKIDNGGGNAAELRDGSYRVRIDDYSTGLGSRSRRAVPSIPLDVMGGTAYTVYAVGSLSNGTFDIIVQTFDVN